MLANGYTDSTTGQCRYAGDGGPATIASLCNPTDLAFDPAGNLYIADQSNHRVRRIDTATGIITTYAGNGMNNGLLPPGDGGPATDAQVIGPTGLGFDSAGNLFISAGLRIRKVDASPQHIITTVAGDGTVGFSGDGGPATSAKLVLVFGLADDGAGNLLISDWAARRLRRVDGITAIPLQPATVVSRKTHGSTGAFDISLPLTGSPGIECRTGGASGNYKLIFSFANTLTSVGGASVTSGIGSVSSHMMGSNTHNYIVNLTGVSNAQMITVSLTDVNDSAGKHNSFVPISMRVLIGDTTGNGSVNSSDIGQTKSQSGQATTATNFRTDVNVNGVINASDISTVKSRSGTALP